MTSSNMKPLLLIAGETLGLGGAEKVTVDLANALYGSGDYRVAVVTTLAPGGLFADRLAEEVATHHVSTPDELVCLVAELRPDGLLLNNCRMAKHGIDAIVTAHQLAYLGFFLHGFSTWSLNLLPRELPKGAHVLTISREAKFGILRARPDIPRRSVGVITNGVDTDRFRPLAEDEEPAVQVWEPESGPVFGYAGRFSGEKALVTMVDVFRRAREQLPKAKLLMVGGEDPGVPVHTAYWRVERVVVEQAVRQLGLEDAAHITGAVPNPEDYYPLMDVFLLTSHFEGVPLVLLEAMSCGVPSVCTAVGAIPRLLRHGAGVAVARQKLDLNEAEREFFAAKMVEVATSERRKERGDTARRSAIRLHSMNQYRRVALRYFHKRLPTC